MGHVVLMDDSEAEFALTRYSQWLWLDLKTELPPQAEFEQRGTLWVAAGADDNDVRRVDTHRRIPVLKGSRGSRIRVASELI